MKKTHSKETSVFLNEKLGFGSLILLLGIVTLFFLLLSNITKPIPNHYFINFYDGDTLVTTEKLEEGSVISDERLTEITNMCLDDKYDYKYLWSVNKDTYIEAFFKSIVKDTDVYLFKYLDEFEITVKEHDSFNYELLTDGPIIEGSNVEFSIEQLLNPKQYHMNVYANNQLIVQNENGNYLIENINEDTCISVRYLEIMYLEFILSDVYIYDSSPHELDYVVKDYEGNEKDISDILIRYYDTSGNEVDKVINAGKYKASMTYIGSEYYIDAINTEFVVDKAKPTINVVDKYVYYDSSPQGFDILDVETNSDGQIVFSNNSNIDVGSYEVDISIGESPNYYAVSTKAYINILQAKPIISKNPIADVGFEGRMLGDVGITDGVANVPGTFRWKDPDKVLDVGTHEYALVFEPVDKHNYQSIELLISVETITYIEQLERIKSERIKLLDSIDLDSIDKLPTKSTSIKADIIWMSLSSTVMVNGSGAITVIGSPGSYTVDIIGIMMFGDTAEYVTITLNVVIDTGGGIQVSRL